MKKFLLLLVALVTLHVTSLAETPSYTLDFANKNTITGIPTSSGSTTNHATIGDIYITTSKCYKSSSNAYLMIEKNGTLSFTLSNPATKIILYWSSGTSTKPSVGLYLGTSTTAHGDAHKPSTNGSATYNITDIYETTYTFKNDNAANAQLTKLEIYQELGKPVTLSFPENNYSATLGVHFIAPELNISDPNAAEFVEYSSRDTNVATVDKDGNITLISDGITTITAEIKTGGEYRATSTSYHLNVIDPNATSGTTIFKSTENEFQSSSTKGYITLNFGGNGTATVFNAEHVRFYASNSLTISSPQGTIIKGIEFTQNGTYSWDNIKVGDNVISDGKYTAEENTNEIVVTNSGSAQVRFTELKVNWVQLPSPAPWARVSEDGLVTIEVRVDGKPVEAEIFYAVTSSNVAPEKVDNIYSEPFQLNEGISYVWATARIEGYATSPITNVLMAQYDGDKAVIGLPYTKHDANELREGHWYIVVAQGNDGSYLAMGDVNAAGHHEAIKVAHNGTSIDAVDFDSKGIHEFQCVGGNLVEKNSHNHLAPAPEAQEAHALSLVEAAPTTTFANNGDSHSLTINGKTLGYDTTTGTFGFTGDHTGNVMLYTTGGNVNTGIDEVTVPTDDTVEYYNLQGIRVTNPTGGLYLRRQGNRVTKVIL